MSAVEMPPSTASANEAAIRHPPAELARSVERLPTLLSVIAGMVEVIAYLRLGNLFTAHVTGNIVVSAALLARGESLNVPQVLAVPIFLAAVVAVWLLTKASNWRGAALVRPLLLVQFLLLAGVLALSVIADLAASPNGIVASTATTFAVSAMACQFSLLRLAVPGAPSTAVMTGNLTNAVLSLLETLSPGRPLMNVDDGRLTRVASLLVGFCIGCIGGAVGASVLGAWSWSLPVGLAGAMVASRTARS